MTRRNLVPCGNGGRDAVTLGGGSGATATMTESTGVTEDGRCAGAHASAGNRTKLIARKVMSRERLFFSGELQS